MITSMYGRDASHILNLCSESYVYQPCWTYPVFVVHVARKKGLVAVLNIRQRTKRIIGRERHFLVSVTVSSIHVQHEWPLQTNVQLIELSLSHQIYSFNGTLNIDQSNLLLRLETRSILDEMLSLQIEFPTTIFHIQAYFKKRKDIKGNAVDQKPLFLQLSNYSLSLSLSYSYFYTKCLLNVSL